MCLFRQKKSCGRQGDVILVLRDATPIRRTEYIDFGEMCDRNILWPCNSKVSSSL